MEKKIEFIKKALTPTAAGNIAKHIYSEGTKKYFGKVLTNTLNKIVYNPETKGILGFFDKALYTVRKRLPNFRIFDRSAVSNKHFVELAKEQEKILAPLAKQEKIIEQVQGLYSKILGTEIKKGDVVRSILYPDAKNSIMDAALETVFKQGDDAALSVFANLDDAVKKSLGAADEAGANNLIQKIKAAILTKDTESELGKRVFATISQKGIALPHATPTEIFQFTSSARGQIGGYAVPGNLRDIGYKKGIMIERGGKEYTYIPKSEITSGSPYENKILESGIESYVDPSAKSFTDSLASKFSGKIRRKSSFFDRIFDRDKRSFSRDYFNDARNYRPIPVNTQYAEGRMGTIVQQQILHNNPNASLHEVINDVVPGSKAIPTTTQAAAQSSPTTPDAEDIGILKWISENPGKASSIGVGGAIASPFLYSGAKYMLSSPKKKRPNPMIRTGLGAALGYGLGTMFNQKDAQGNTNTLPSLLGMAAGGALGYGLGDDGDD